MQDSFQGFLDVGCCLRLAALVDGEAWENGKICTLKHCRWVQIESEQKLVDEDANCLYE